MTFLDDYQPHYKLWGLFTARAMLNRVPPELLRRTGIEGLLRTVRPSVVMPFYPAHLFLAVFQKVSLTTRISFVSAKYQAGCVAVTEINPPYNTNRLPREVRRVMCPFR
jgi:hypothetical protein